MLVVGEFTHAIATGDAEAVNRLIDFPALRSSLKAEAQQVALYRLSGHQKPRRCASCTAGTPGKDTANDSMPDASLATIVTEPVGRSMSGVPVTRGEMLKLLAMVVSMESRRNRFLPALALKLTRFAVES